MKLGPNFWFLLVGALLLTLARPGVGDIDLMNNNELTDSSAEDTKQAPRKYDPSIFDILGSDYFDDDSPKGTKGKENGNAPQAPSSGFPVEPVVEEETVTTSRPYCVGCPIEVDPEDDKVKEIATFAFETHQSNFDALEQAQRMVRVISAMTQIVAGQKYILELEVGLTNCTKGEHDNNPSTCQLDPTQETFICNFEVVEQKWLNNKEVVRSKCSREEEKEADAEAAPVDDDEYQKEDAVLPADDMGSDEIEETTTTVPEIIYRRRKRDTKNLGGQRDAEESKEKLMELATFAIQQLDEIDADTDARMVVEVLSAKKQTVAGWIYDLTIRVAHTTCPEGEPVTIEKCKDKIVAPYRICSVKILFQPWQTAPKKVTESQCHPEKYKKGKKMANHLSLLKQNEDENDVNKRSERMLGGFQDIDVNDAELMALADFAIASVEQKSNALHAQKLVKIHQAQRQMVSGVKTKLIIELGYTGCRKTPSLDKSQCEIDDSRDHQFCDVTVWEQSWLKSKKVTDSKCGARSTILDRNKRSLFSVPGFNDAQHEEFGKFLDKYGKKYESDEEYQYRLGVFKENMQKVLLLQKHEQGTATYGATVFADLTEEEFAKYHLGLRPDLKQGVEQVKKAKIPILRSVPDEFDWRNYNAVTPVKNQGMCGSCWAFSVTGNVEGLYANKHNQLVSFSEQELVDCDTLDQGCNGGLPENAYKSIQKLGGLETESAYPYDGHNDKCSFESGKATAKVKGFVEIPKNETEMAMWLVKNGPISIGINANAMQFYFGGVSHPWKFLCSKKSLDHGVLIVGYGVHTTSIRHKTMPYWIVKNSWGPSWGEKGYYRVYRGENTCGVAEMATSAVVE